MDLCDCYVSLHRSEGLGLTMAEAMALGKPVIATGYSGNLHFMTPDNSYLVDYSRVAVPSGCDPYPAGAKWAEPDAEQAAELMRLVYRGPRETERQSGARSPGCSRASYARHVCGGHREPPGRDSSREEDFSGSVEPGSGAGRGARG